MSGTPTVSDRLKYRFDNYMARGGSSIFLSLVVIFAVFLIAVVLLRLLISLILSDGAGGADRGAIENAFVAFLQISDPGGMAEDLASSQWYMLAALISGIGGVIMVSVLIAFVTTALDTRLAKLRRGHSQVVEKGHTLILGWEEQRVVEIIRELSIANESERHKAVVVLAERDKEYMDDLLSLQIPDSRSTRIVTRSGSPASLVNLNLVSVQTAKSAIVLADCSDAATDRDKAESDARAIKALLALEADQSGSHQLNVVVELFGAEARAMCDSIGVGSITALDVTTLLAKIVVQTSRSVGLSVVYNELLSFEGAEFYVVNEDWGGSSFREASCRFARGVPIGVKEPDGSITINPELDRPLSQDDRLVVLAEDDSTIRYAPEPVAEQHLQPVPGGRLEMEAERQLVIGWGPKAAGVLAEYAQYVPSGSSVDIIPRISCSIDPEVDGMDVKVLPYDPLDPETWDVLDPLRYNHVILLSEGVPDATAEAIDAETIMILLLFRSALRRAEEASPGRRPTVVTELLESDNHAVASNVGVYDFVISSRIVSMLLAQIAEQPEMNTVYESLLNEEGSEIYLKPVNLYVPELPTELPFCDVMALANDRGEICIGVKAKKDEQAANANYGVRLIPRKDESIELVDGDALVVLAVDER